MGLVRSGIILLSYRHAVEAEEKDPGRASCVGALRWHVDGGQRGLLRGAVSFAQGIPHLFKPNPFEVLHVRGREMGDSVMDES